MLVSFRMSKFGCATLFAKRCIALVFALSLSLVVEAYANTTDAHPLLWQNFRYGMTPEEVLPQVLQTQGVKRAKVLKLKKTNSSRRLDIDFAPSKIGIAGIPFELGPVFEHNRLHQIALASQKMCADGASSLYDRLSEALVRKYSSPISAPAIKLADLKAAESKSYRSGGPVGLMTAFANDDVAVTLSFQITHEPPPPYPEDYSKFAVSLWQLAKVQYDQRKADCAGTGDKRMDVTLIYMRRADFDAAVSTITNEQDTSRAADRDKL